MLRKNELPNPRVLSKLTGVEGKQHQPQPEAEKNLSA